MNTTQILSSRKKCPKDKKDRASRRKQSHQHFQVKIYFNREILAVLYTHPTVSHYQQLVIMLIIIPSHICHQHTMTKVYHTGMLPFLINFLSHYITKSYSRLHSQENLNQPPELIYVPPLEPIALLDNIPDQHDYLSPTNIAVSPVE